MSLDSGDAQQPDAASAAGAPTRRTTSHRVELRTPRLVGESDEAYKRRIQVAWVGAMIHSIGWVAAAIAILYFTDMWNVLRYDTRINRSLDTLRRKLRKYGCNASPHRESSDIDPRARTHLSFRIRVYVCASALVFVSSFLLLAVLFGFVLSLVIAYLAVWLPMRSTRPILDLSAHAPTAIPIGTGAGVATFTWYVTSAAHAFTVGTPASLSRVSVCVCVCVSHRHACRVCVLCSLFSFLIAVWPIWGFVTIPIVIVLAMASCLGPNLLPF